MKSTGFCIFDENMIPVLIDSIPTKDTLSHGKRLKIIADKMIELKELYPTNTICIERGFSQFNTATQVIYRVHGICNLVFYDCEQIYYPPKSVKEAIVAGNATKNQLQDAIKNKYNNIVFKNEDESDAFSIGLTYFIKTGKIQWEKIIIPKAKKLKTDKKTKETKEKTKTNKS